MQNPVLRSRNWSSVASEYATSTPIPHAVIDDFLCSDTLESLHRALCDHWGWRQHSWISQHLRNGAPKIDLVERIAEASLYWMRPIIGELDFVDHWALMYHQNRGGSVHADDAKVTLNLWLTPDEHNLDPTSGGMYLFDVPKDAARPPHEYLLAATAEPYVASRVGLSVYIPYKCNRAIIFDSSYFHKSADLNFDTHDASRCRMNVTFLFDTLDVLRERYRTHYGDQE